MTGRVNLDNKPGTSFHLFENAQTPYSFGNSTRSVQGKSALNELFFSQENVELIHRNIISRVSSITGYRIGDRVIQNPDYNVIDIV